MPGYSFDWTVLVREPYLGLLTDGFVLTVQLILVTLGSAFVLGVPIGVVRLSTGLPGRISFWYVEFLRSTPPLIHVLLWFFGASVLFPGPVYGWLLDNNLRFWSVAVALTIYTSAFIAEIVRGGIGAVPAGQFEAARAIGLTRFEAARFVIFPQVVRIVTPATLNEVVSLTKNTSLGVAIGLPDLMYAGRIISDYTFRPVEAFTAVGAGYLILVFSVVALSKLLTRRFEERQGT